MHSNALSRAIFWVLACLLFPSLVWSQGAFIPSKTVTSVVNGIQRPVSGASITVCAASTSGLPCSPALANAVWKDSALTQAQTNPSFTDANGNYPPIALAGGQYTITETSAGFTGFSYQVSVTCGVGPCTATSLTVTGPATFTGNNTQKSMDCIKYVDPANAAGWTGTEPGAWLNAAIVAAGLCGNPAGTGAVIVAPGGYTATTSVTIISGVTVKLSAGLTWASNASPNWTVAGTGSVGANLIGDAENSVNLANTGAAVAVSIAAGSNFSNLHGFSINGSNAASDAIVMGDNIRALDISNLNISGTLHCATETPGAFGDILVSFHEVYCHNIIGNSGYLFDNTSGSPSGVTFDHTDVTTSSIAFTGYVIANGNYRFNYSAADSPATGYLFGTPTSNTSVTMINTDTEFGSAVGISIQGPGNYDIIGHNCGTYNPGPCLAIASANAHGMIIDMRTTGTVGANDITATAASTGSWTIIGGAALSKTISFTSPACYGQINNGTYTSTCTGGTVLLATTATTNQKFIQLGNTGNTGFYFGVENSTGSFFGANANESVLYSPSNTLFLSTPTARFSGVVRSIGGFFPNAAGAANLGSVPLPFGNLCLGTAATNNLCTSVSAMAAQRTLTVSDPLGNVNMPYVIASGTSTLTSNATLAAVTSQAAITTAATNTLTTDAIEWSYATAPTAGDSLCHVSPYVTAGNVNFVRTNPTAAAQNVSALVINWRVIR